MIKLEKFDVENIKHTNLLDRANRFPKKYTYCIENETEMIGCITVIPEYDQDCSVDVVILPEFQNQGYGTEACKLVEELIGFNYDKVIARPVRYNIAAIKMLEKSGFRMSVSEYEKIADEGIEDLLGYVKEKTKIKK